MPSRGTNRPILDSVDLGDYEGAFIHKFKLTSAVKAPPQKTHLSPQVIKVRQLIDAAAEEQDRLPAGGPSRGRATGSGVSHRRRRWAIQRNG